MFVPIIDSTPNTEAMRRKGGPHLLWPAQIEFDAAELELGTEGRRL